MSLGMHCMYLLKASLYGTDFICTILMGFLIKEETSERERLLVGSTPQSTTTTTERQCQQFPHPAHNQRGSKDIFLSSI